MIELQDVSKSFGNFEALSGISLKIDSASGITALLGPNGAGKSTTMRLITGYLRPTNGVVKVGEISSSDTRRFAEVKKKIGYLPESAPLYPEMLVSEYLNFSAKVRGLDNLSSRERIADMTEQLDLSGHFYTPIGLLSKGFRQRVALAGTLIHDPEIIILDEPTSGLDPNQIVHIRNIIRQLGKSRTLILSTHILQEVKDICERVIIMNRGSVVADETLSSLTGKSGIRMALRGSDVLQALSEFHLTEKAELLSENPVNESGQSDDHFRIYNCVLKEDSPEQLFRYICSKGIDAREFSVNTLSLEDIFKNKTL
jgi:ABC-2 type transport system ATP-binding protein